MKKGLLLLLLVSVTVCVMAQTITPAQTDEIIIDNGTSGEADPGDRIRYRVTIQNTGGANGTGVQLNAVPDPKTTFVPGSFRSSPLAVPDAYTCTGNVGINVPAVSGLKANDFDDNIAGLTVTVGTFASTQGGTVSLAADGSFTYNPPAGFTGTDVFTYTITDGNPVGAPVPMTDMANVTITVSDLIWFINNSAAAGDGRVNTPFNSLAAFNSGSAAAASVVYLEHTGTDYNGVLTLQAGERLVGEGHTGAANLSGVLPFALAPNSNPLPNINGSRPVIVNNAGNGIALASNNGVRGVDVGNTTGADIIGSAFGTLTLSEVTLSGTGKALDLNNGTLNATFTSVTSTSSANEGIALQSVGGTANLGSTTISGCAASGIFVGISTVDINFGNTTITPGTHGVSLTNNPSGTRTFGTLSVTNGAGMGFQHTGGGGLTNITGQTTITNPGGRGIDIENAIAGNGVTFADVSITQTGNTGVYLIGNAGNITFADLDVAPDANIRAILATENVGTITTTSGTISNSGSVGIEITKASGTTPLAMVLTSVSASGSSNGIILSGTSGSFAINGTGATAGSGGTIQNMSSRGASFTNASNITLSNMTFTNNASANGTPCTSTDNSGCNAGLHFNTVTNVTLTNLNVSGGVQHGINAREVNGFTLSNSTVTQNGSEVQESNLMAQNLFGNVSILNSTLSFPGENVASITNTDKNATFTVTSSSFNDTQSSTNGSNGLIMSFFGNSNSTISITNCNFLRCKTNGAFIIGENNSITNVTNTGSNVDPELGVGVGFDHGINNSANLKFKVLNGNTIRGRLTNVVNVFGFSGSYEGRINNNIVTSLSGSGSGIRQVAQSSCIGVCEVKNNTVSGINNDIGITGVARSGAGTLDITIMGNNITVANTASYNIETAAGNSGSTFTNIVCANVANNTVVGMPITNYFARTVNAHELKLQGPGPNVVTNWNMNGNSVAPPATTAQSGTGTFTFGATCVLPTN